MIKLPTYDKTPHNRVFNCSDVEEPTQTEVAIVSHMFSNISNYWLYGYKDKILLLGGLCTAQVSLLNSITFIGVNK